MKILQSMSNETCGIKTGLHIRTSRILKLRATTHRVMSGGYVNPVRSSLSKLIEYNSEVGAKCTR